MSQKGTVDMHYVPREYLKKFRKDDWGYCLEIHTNTLTKLKKYKGKACVSHLYSVRQPITNIDLWVYENLLPDYYKKGPIKKTHELFVSFMKDKMGEFLKNHRMDTPEIADDLETFSEIFDGSSPISKNLETLATYYETSGSEVINSIINSISTPTIPNYDFSKNECIYALAFLIGDLCQEIYSIMYKSVRRSIKASSETEIIIPSKISIDEIQDKNSINFLFLLRYMIFQKNRTLAKLDETKATISSVNNEINSILVQEFGSNTNLLHQLDINAVAIWQMLAFHHTALECFTYIQNKGRFILLRNTSTDSFITSDNPVIELEKSDKESDNFLFTYYFPISPQCALLFTNSPSYKNVNLLDINNVQSFNSSIRAHAYKYLFADSERLLSSITKTD